MCGQEEASRDGQGASSIRRAAKLLERMANQNMQRDIIMDFKVGFAALIRPFCSPWQSRKHMHVPAASWHAKRMPRMRSWLGIHSR